MRYNISSPVCIAFKLIKIFISHTPKAYSFHLYKHHQHFYILCVCIRFAYTSISVHLTLNNCVQKKSKHLNCKQISVISSFDDYTQITD